MCIRDSFKTCKKKTVRKEWLEDLVVAETMKLIQNDAVIDAIVAEAVSYTHLRRQPAPPPGPDKRSPCLRPAVPAARSRRAARPRQAPASFPLPQAVPAG